MKQHFQLQEEKLPIVRREHLELLRVQTAMEQQSGPQETDGNPGVEQPKGSNSSVGPEQTFQGLPAQRGLEHPGQAQWRSWGD